MMIIPANIQILCVCTIFLIYVIKHNEPSLQAARFKQGIE